MNTNFTASSPIRSALLVLAALTTSATCQQFFPKHRVQPVPNNDTLLSTLTPPPEIVQTRAAAFVGTCSPTQPYSFKVNGGNGRGAIGCISPEANITTLSFENEENGEIAFYPEYKESNFFALADDRQHQAFPFRFNNVKSVGAKVLVECDAGTGIVVLMRDDNVKIGRALQVKTYPADSNGTHIIEHVDNFEGRAFKMRAESFHENSMAKNGRKLDISERGSTRRILKDVGGSDGDIVLLHMESLDESNNLVQRTIFKKTKTTKRKVFKLHVGEAYINTDHDVVIPFKGHPVREGYFLDFVARVGIELNGVLISEEIDVASIQEGETASLTIHGGWVRRTLQALGLEQGDEFDLVVTEAVATDPQDGYAVAGFLKGPVVLNLKNHEHRRHLAMTPSQEELDITDEMRMGRRPDVRRLLSRASGKNKPSDMTSVGNATPDSGPRRRNLRQLQVSKRRKIIVHGYCATAGSSFPVDQFSPASEYRHTKTNKRQGISHFSFAYDLLKYIKMHGITSCGIIAHSQGGPAALTLYANWWSCLDYGSGGTRLIQSVGSPYQGSPLAGDIALLGNIFGLGCGAVHDLSVSGAPSWLAGIPSWAQNKVYYYTTEYDNKSSWWNDYCHLASDVLLSDPEDGITEDFRAHLPYGNFMGLTSGQCHTKEMRNLYQCEDAKRNAIMNATAMY